MMDKEWAIGLTEEDYEYLFDILPIGATLRERLIACYSDAYKHGVFGTGGVDFRQEPTSPNNADTDGDA